MVPCSAKVFLNFFFQDVFEFFENWKFIFYFLGDVMICMEVMDISLDKFYARAFNRNKPIPEDVLGKVAYSVIILFFFQLRGRPWAP